jgi:hypothetical protein
VGFVLLLVWGWDVVQTRWWVGSTDLEVEFVIVTADTGQPVPGARIEIRSEGGFYEGRETREFVLLTDGSGVARKECRNNMCCGTRSGLGFTDTFSVHLPWWQFRVSATGFESSEWVYLLDVVRDRQRADRIGPGKAKLVVPVSLQKKPAGPNVAAEGGRDPGFYAFTVSQRGRRRWAESFGGRVMIPAT